MILQDILDVNGWTRSRYDALKSRTGLPFMAKCVREDRRQSKYALSHAVGIGVMDDFQKLGVGAERAARVVDEVFDYIHARVEASQGQSIEMDAVLPEWVYYVDNGPSGWGFSAGSEPIELDATAQVMGKEARYRVDIYAVLRRLNAWRAPAQV